MKISKIFTYLQAGNVELAMHQGSTSNEPVVEVLKHPISHFFTSKHKEHVVTVTQGFYISLKGLFRPKSTLAIIYSAFSYKGGFNMKKKAKIPFYVLQIVFLTMTSCAIIIVVLRRT